jgi:hypothetical protein
MFRVPAKEPGTWGKETSPNGKDPLAIKQLGKTFQTDPSPLQPQYRGGSPLSMENVNTKAFIQSLKSNIKTSAILQETLNAKETDKDSGTMLDESQLLDD